MAELKITSNVLSVIKALNGIDELLNHATSMALRRTGEAVKKEGARLVRDSGYASKKLTVGKIYKWIEVENGMVNPGISFARQEVSISFSPKGLPLMYFSPVNVTFNTKRGKRYGVDVTVFGKKIKTGGFHLTGRGRAQKQGSPGGRGTFGPDSGIFYRVGGKTGSGKGKLERFKFIGVGRVLELNGREDKLYDYGYRYLDNAMNRELSRAAHMLMADIRMRGV